MTKIFNMFKRVLKPAQPQHPAVADANPTQVNTPEVPRELFVNDQAPAFSGGRQYIPEVLQQFFDRNFFQSGFNDGYRYHSLNVRTNTLRTMKSEFRNLVRDCIRDEKARLHMLQNDLISVDGLSPAFEDKLRLGITACNERISLLEREFSLSVDDEGLVAECLNSYIDGFERGTAIYLEEVLLLTGGNPIQGSVNQNV